jgi:hypothetical protein
VSVNRPTAADVDALFDGDEWETRYRRGWWVIVATPTGGRLVFDPPDVTSCAYLAKGFCGASVDGYCIGGTSTGRCHG